MEEMDKRVVITGLGAITPIGKNVDETWNSIKEQKCGIDEITLFNTENFKTKLAAEVSKKVKAVTIGIGAGNGCDGQVLVYADALGMTQGFKPKFLRHFAQVGEEMTKGVKAYIDAVKTVDYPSAEESY